MINTKRPNTNDYTQVGFIEAKDDQGNYQNIDHIYDSEGNIVFQQGYLNEYDGANDFRIPAIGKPLIDYTIYGNTFQDGIPTPDNPVIPQGTGERTGNLAPPLTEWVDGYVSASGAIAPPSENYKEKSSDYIPVKVGREYTFSVGNKFPGGTYYPWRAIGWYTQDKTFISRASGNAGGALSTSAPSNAVYCRLSYRTHGETTNPMLNSGSTPLPYEPYGYKIPILSASTTTPVYLGAVQTTRRIKKLVLTGKENWVLSNNRLMYTVKTTKAVSYESVLCTHYTSSKSFIEVYNTTNSTAVTNQGIYVNSGSTDIADFKSYLAAQYAAGTPVTVWYVLATEETGIVNEPLMRIGDYTDTLSMEQAGVQIPTLKHPNTTVIDVTTSLPPSEVYAKYRGSKTQQYDLFLAANGDSFEAKNGQSLYIGDDT